jgi:putative transposase
LRFVRQQFVPWLRKGDVVVMDNLNIHKMLKVRATIEAAGAFPVYLPTYSPELNPIELWWGHLKRSVCALALDSVHALAKNLRRLRWATRLENIAGWFRFPSTTLRSTDLGFSRATRRHPPIMGLGSGQSPSRRFSTRTCRRSAHPSGRPRAPDEVNRISRPTRPQGYGADPGRAGVGPIERRGPGHHPMEGACVGGQATRRAGMHVAAGIQRSTDRQPPSFIVPEPVDPAIRAPRVPADEDRTGDRSRHLEGTGERLCRDGISRVGSIWIVPGTLCRLQPSHR